MREWLERYDLLGARGLALAGGTVMLLGVVFLFVLAVNRGWVGPSARIAIGAGVSALLVGVGLALERRYGLLDAAVAAVATGIAGGYATLAAATMLYEMVPTWGALVVAVVIATAASAIAVAWKAELIGILGLLGALSAPALVAIDEGLTAEGSAFALLVFGASAAVAAWMRWRWLLTLAAIDVFAQVLVLAADVDPGALAAIAVAYATAAALVAAAVGWQFVTGRASLDWLSIGIVAMATTVAGVTLRLFESDLHAGTATLVAAIVAAAVSTALARWFAPLGEALVVAAAVLVAAGVGTWWVEDVAAGGTAAIAVAQVTAATLAAGAIGWQLLAARLPLDRAAAALVAVATALLVASSPVLFALDRTRGVALLVAAIVAVAASTVLARRLAPLGELVGLAGVVLAAAGVVAWAVGDIGTRDWTAVDAAAAAALALLCGAIGWQLQRDEAGLHRMAALFVTATTALVLGSSRILFALDRDRGIALLVAAAAVTVAAVGVYRRAVDLTRVLGATALVVVAVATADLVSGRNLAIAWSAQATALAVIAYVARNLRSELAALGYLGLALGHLAVVDLGAADASGRQDLLAHAAPPLFAIAASAVAVGLLAPRTRADAPSSGLLAPLEPLWAGLLRARVALRASLVTLAFVLATLATDGLADGRTLTVVWALQTVVIATAALLAREIRLQPFALLSLLLAVGHALAFEARPSTLFEPVGFDVLPAVPSVAAALVATSVAAATALVRGPGIAWLGALDGPELALLQLRRAQPHLRIWLAAAAIVLALFGAGLLLVAADYTVGQVATTVIWSVVALAAIAVCARLRLLAQLAAGWALLAVAVTKGVAFDSTELSTIAGGWSLLLLAVPLVLAGLVTRWLVTPTEEPLEGVAAVVAAAALVLAWWGLDRLTASDGALGLTLLGVAAGYAALAAVPYLRWRRGEDLERPWLRRLTTAYWLVGLAPLLAGEALVIESRPGIATAFGATAAALAVAAVPLREPLLALAGVVLLGGTTIATLAVVTPPDRFFEASEHPGAALWSLAVITAAWLVVAVSRGAQRFVPALWAWLVVGVLSIYLLSLGILELAQRVSGGTVTTDFQRGHTGVSVAWAVIALALFGVGLGTERAWLRWAGLSLFGIALAKLFLYDLRTLSSMTRALSFLFVGALLLAAAFFAQRLTRHDRDSWLHGPPRAPAG